MLEINSNLSTVLATIFKRMTTKRHSLPLLDRCILCNFPPSHLERNQHLSACLIFCPKSASSEENLVESESPNEIESIT